MQIRENSAGGHGVGIVKTFASLEAGRRICFVLRPGVFPFQIDSFVNISSGEERSEAIQASCIVTVLDVPAGRRIHHLCAAIFVPQDKAEDWIFCSEGGQWQLLGSASVARLILIKDTGSDAITSPEYHANLKTFVQSLAPRMGDGEAATVPFVSYSDDVVHRAILEETESILTGKILVEDVMVRAEGENNRSKGSGGCVPANYILRRRLRFWRMPDLIQSEVALKLTSSPGANAAVISLWDAEGRAFSHGSVAELLQTSSSLAEGEDMRAVPSSADVFALRREIDHSVLVHKYLPPIVAGLSLIGASLMPLMEMGVKPRILILGGGGFALPTFLQHHFHAHIEVVEQDSTVVDLACRHFGLDRGEDMVVHVSDAAQFVSSLALRLPQDQVEKVEEEEEEEARRLKGGAMRQAVVAGPETPRKFHAVVMDIDAEDGRLNLSAPPPEFVAYSFLHSLSQIIHNKGMLAINVVPAAAGAELAGFGKLALRLKRAFAELHQLAMEDEGNVVAFALKSPAAANHSAALQRLLEAHVHPALIESIIRI